jgi:hypothetical protein
LYKELESAAPDGARGAAEAEEAAAAASVCTRAGWAGAARMPPSNGKGEATAAGAAVREVLVGTRGGGGGGEAGEAGPSPPATETPTGGGGNGRDIVGGRDSLGGGLLSSAANTLRCAPQKHRNCCLVRSLERLPSRDRQVLPAVARYPAPSRASPSCELGSLRRRHAL